MPALGHKADEAVAPAAYQPPIAEHLDEHPDEHLARQERLDVLSRSGRRTGTGTWRRLASCCVMLLMVAAAAIGGLGWRLSHGPMAVPFLTETVRKAIAVKLPPGYQVSLGGVSIDYRNKGLTALLDGLTVGDESGPLASAPRIAVGLDTLSLLTGSVSPRSIVVEGAAATVNVSADGRFSLRPGLQPASVIDDGDMSPLAAMNALDALLASAGTIDAVEVHDATLEVRDLAFQRDVTHPHINLTIRRTAAAGGLSVALAALGGTVNATVVGSGDEPRMIDIHASNIALRELTAAMAPGAEQPAMTASFDLLARARIEPDGTLGLAEANVTNDGGIWDVDPQAPPFKFDGARIALHWDLASHTILVDRIMMKAGEGVIDFKGAIAPPSAATQGLWTYNLMAPNVLLSARRAEEPPLKLDAVSLQGRYDPVARKLSIDKGNAVGPTVALDFGGSVTFTGRTPGIILDVAAKSLSAVALPRLWPIFCVPRAKAWLEDHIKGGTVEDAKLSIAIPSDTLVAVNGKTPPLPDNTLSGELTLTNGTVEVLDTLPPLRAMKARAVFGGRHLSVALESGEADVGDAGTLDVTDGSYAIANFALVPPLQTIEFNVSGPSRAIASLMGRPPLSDAIKGLDLNPNDVTGDADLKVKLDLPMVDHPANTDIHYAITGSIENMSIAKISGGELENGDMKLVIEPGLLLMTGKGVFDGLPANIDLRKASDRDMQVAMTVTLDDATRKKKGIDFGDALTGPITADIRQASDTEDPHFDIDVDLTAARIKDLLPGWQKAAGKSAKVSFSWDPAENGGGVAEDIVLDGGSVALRGEVALTGDNKLRKATMSAIRLSPGDDFQGTFEPSANGWKIGIRGKQLDARPLLAMLQKRTKAAGAVTNFAGDIQIDKIIGFNDEALTNFDLSLETKATTIRKLDLKGKSDNGELTASLVPGVGGASQVVAQSSDAGAVMRFLDYYTHLQGGQLDATVTPVIDNMKGTLVLRSFVVVNEPALGQYRSTLKNSGRSSNDAPVPQSSDSAKFTKLHLMFTRTATRVGIVDSVVWGPDVGVSLSGDIDYGGDRVNLTGTFVPAYALNNIFAQIPVLGEILGGGQYGGLFAINFKVAGRIAAPVLTVNPLSAIAPGFLRKIFEFQKDTQ